jgi:serine/threonine protein kinase
VKLAVDEATGQKVALKVLSTKRRKKLSEELFEAEVRRRSARANAAAVLTRQVAAMRSLTHPNIIRLIGVIREEGRLCMVLEYAAGGDLLDHVSAAPGGGCADAGS